MSPPPSGFLKTPPSKSPASDGCERNSKKWQAKPPLQPETHRNPSFTPRKPSPTSAPVEDPKTSPQFAGRQPSAISSQVILPRCPTSWFIPMSTDVICHSEPPQAGRGPPRQAQGRLCCSLAA